MSSFSIGQCKLQRATCSRFDTILHCDRRMDRRTDGQTDGIAVAITALTMRALWRAVKPRLHDTTCCQRPDHNWLYNLMYIRFDNRLNEQWLFVQHGCQTGLYNRLYNRIDNRLNEQLFGCLFTRYSRLSNRLYNRFDNRLYRVNGV